LRYSQKKVNNKLNQQFSQETIVNNTLNKNIKLWLKTISQNETLPHDIKAICIGLFEGNSTYQIYFIASKEYDTDDDDWACNQDYEPEAMYLDSGISTSQKWDSFQAEVIDAVKSILELDNSTVLKKAVHVSVGFDSAELIHIV
jgi:hypothetical protein